MSEDTQKDVVAQAGDTASVEQPVIKLTAAQKKAAAKVKAENTQMASVSEAVEVETANASAPFEPERYPATVLLVNRTYATVAYPEVGNVCLRGGESQVVTVKTAEIMATLQRNVNSFNGIGKWVAPHGVFIEAVPEAQQE
ncbi:MULTISPECIES: hypothetical protein [Vitreoscilla]|uniref:Uncharacterized protein n=1 Tax=Vitreoscilla stercoraria TaxID=61 RepID=A0ABY4EDM5_VITST|nr:MULTISPECIES: hypothetical protein [Vitreoscilla]AUZ05275.1 hypothetical protein ADP71_17480 [Vitreoscilla sp. C1]UOO93396.1 hypothetical protein LVJ81_05040 [Vitreoscilla stercoraria]